jgi:phosphoribosyl 1,2-cyclic phosphodiesterase
VHALFHEDLVVVPLGSGSRGNATYVGDGRHGVLVDCGLSTRQIMARLDAAGLGGAPIDAVLITHEHTDHIGAAGVLDRHLAKQRGVPCPFFLTKGTHDALPTSLRPTDVRLVRPGERIGLAGLTLQPHTVPHDTADPVAWTIEAHGVRAGVVTDLGHAPRATEALLATLDVAVVEFNHDEQLLLDGSYPWPLKQRIRGRHGHLSNRQAARLVREGARGRLRHLVLGHLSEENNTPGHAVEAATWALRDGGLHDVTVHVAAQDVHVGPFRVGPAPIATAPARRPRPERADVPPPPDVQENLF